MSSRLALLAIVLACFPALSAWGAGTSHASRSSPSMETTGTARAASAATASGGGSTGRAGGSSMRGGYRGPVPPPDPGRKISEQDCTRPMVLDGGNLRCK